MERKVCEMPRRREETRPASGPVRSAAHGAVHRRLLGFYAPLLAGAVGQWTRGGVMARSRRVDTRRSTVVSSASARHYLPESHSYISPSLSPSSSSTHHHRKRKHLSPSSSSTTPTIWPKDTQATVRRRTGLAVVPSTAGIAVAHVGVVRHWYVCGSGSTRPKIAVTHTFS
jgi:hypothetical protein